MFDNISNPLCTSFIHLMVVMLK